MVLSIHSPPRFISCIRHDTLHHKKFTISPRIAVEAYAHWHFRRSDDLTCYLTLTIYHGFVHSIYHHHSWLVFGMTPCTVNSAFHLALRIRHMQVGTPGESVQSLRLYMPRAFFTVLLSNGFIFLFISLGNLTLSYELYIIPFTGTSGSTPGYDSLSFRLKGRRNTPTFSGLSCLNSIIRNWPCSNITSIICLMI